MIEGHLPIEPPKGVTVWDIDPYHPQVLLNLEQYYSRLRSKGAFAYIPKYSILVCGRYKETREVFGDHERFVSSRGVGLQDFKFNKPWRDPSLVLEVDPPYHTKTRMVIGRTLSPKAVSDLKEACKTHADKLIGYLVGKGTFEAVSECAEAFPTAVFPKAVGLKRNHPRRLVDYGEMVFNALGPDNQIRRMAMAKAPDIVPWITESCKRTNLDPNGFGARIYDAADAGEITDEEAAMLVRSLLSAGIDTTVTAIGNALWCLANNPGEFEKLKSDSDLARPCFEEVLRTTSPVHSFCRTANVTTEVGGVTIEEGTKILCVLGSANLDESYWNNAEKFDIERRPIDHLAFGVGIHNCVGQNIARAELDGILTAIAKQVRAIEIIGDPVWRPNNAIHALDHMKIKFH